MQREAKFEKINRWFFPAYVLLCLGAAVYYGVRRDMYHFPLSLLAAAMPVLMALFFRVLRLRRSAQMDFMILLFILLAFPCGSVLEYCWRWRFS